MAETSRLSTATAHTALALLQTPMQRLGEVIADLFAADPAAPQRAGSVDVELRPAPGAELQIEVKDDILTVRGAVLTIRGAGRVAAPEPQKYYY